MSSINSNIYVRPTPAKVAALVASHGMEAATSRWHWLDDRTLGSLAQAGRAAKGEVLQSASKRCSYSELDAAVCVEAPQRQVEEKIVEPLPQESAPADVPAEAEAPEAVAPAEMPEPYGALSPEEAVAVVAGIEASAPLGLHHLALAVRLAGETSLTKAEAISWVRADIHAVAAARVLPPAKDEDDIEAVAQAVFHELMLADVTMGTRQ